MDQKEAKKNYKECIQTLYPLRDSIEILGPKWRIQILIAIGHGNENFTSIQRALENISPRILSQELKVLTEHQLISREVSDTHPVTIKYQLTEHTNTIIPIIELLKEWGKIHREFLFK